MNPFPERVLTSDELGERAVLAIEQMQFRIRSYGPNISPVGRRLYLAAYRRLARDLADACPSLVDGPRGAA